MDWLHNVVTLNLKVIPKLNCWITADCAGHKDMEQCEQLITTSKTAQKSTKTVLSPSFNNSQNSRIFRANIFLLIRTHSRVLNTPDVICRIVNLSFQLLLLKNSIAAIKIIKASIIKILWMHPTQTFATTTDNEFYFQAKAPGSLHDISWNSCHRRLRWLQVENIWSWRKNISTCSLFQTARGR